MTVNKNKHEQPVPFHRNLIFSFLLSSHNCFILLRYLAFYFKVIAYKEGLSKSCCLFHLYILLALCCSWNVCFNYCDSLSFECGCVMTVRCSTTKVVLAKIYATYCIKCSEESWRTEQWMEGFWILLPSYVDIISSCVVKDDQTREALCCALTHPWHWGANQLGGPFAVQNT